MKLHAALVAMARERNVQGVDRRDEVSEGLPLALPHRKREKKERVEQDVCCLTGHVSGVLDSAVAVSTK